MNKNYILKKSHEIEELIKKKQSVGSKYYCAYYAKSEDTKIGISVSKKLGKANVRNYQKRVTREILRDMISELEGFRILLVVKAQTLDLSFDDKQKQIRYILEKVLSNK